MFTISRTRCPILILFAPFLVAGSPAVVDRYARTAAETSTAVPLVDVAEVFDLGGGDRVSEGTGLPFNRWGHIHDH